MKLYEYETKNILKEYGIPTPNGELATNSNQARAVAAKLCPTFAVKAQVLVAGRGKAGGILFANSVDEAETAAEKLFTMQIKGIAVKRILIEEKIPIKKELFLGITLDRVARKYALIASRSGGVDIEEIAEKAPEKIVKKFLDPRTSHELSDAQEIARRLSYGSSQQTALANIIKKLVQAALDYDAELLELNPVAETENGEFVAVDARLIMDDNALFRHKEYNEKLFAEERENTPEEIDALRNGLAYVKLDGDIGVIGNGAGLVMATLDMIQHYGGRAADFLDLGGGAPVERISAALRIVFADPSVKVLFINILGGMTRCDDVARGIVEAKNTLESKLPIVVRLVGTNEEEGKQILNKAGLQVLGSMEEAAQVAIKFAET